MTLNKISCLKCRFIVKDLENGGEVYRCRARALRSINVNNKIMCSRFQRGVEKSIDKEFLGVLAHAKRIIERTYFNTGSRLKLIFEK
jgi:hypothetical protein